MQQCETICHKELERGVVARAHAQGDCDVLEHSLCKLKAVALVLRLGARSRNCVAEAHKGCPACVDHLTAVEELGGRVQELLRRRVQRKRRIEHEVCHQSHVRVAAGARKAPGKRAEGVVELILRRALVGAAICRLDASFRRLVVVQRIHRREHVCGDPKRGSSRNGGRRVALGRQSAAQRRRLHQAPCQLEAFARVHRP